jgi:transposase
VIVKGRSKSEVARDYDVSRYWVQQLCQRYESEGPATFQPHSRRPLHNPRAVEASVEEAIVRLRKTLTRQSYDAGADTIAAHVATDASITPVPAVSTIWRILHRRGCVVPQPHDAPAHRGNGSKPTCPTNVGKPTSPTGSSPTARTDSCEPSMNARIPAGSFCGADDLG